MVNSNLPPLPDMPHELLALLSQIPRGRVSTYGSLAQALGERQASRWVGHFLLHHKHAADCPCHRVVRADGALGSYIEGTLTAKADRLRAEGVHVEHDRVDRQRYEFGAFATSQPLVALSAAQHAAACRLSLKPPNHLPRTVAALDVSYATSGEAVAAYVLADFATAETLWSTTRHVRVDFPYIPSFLTFRELPPLAAVFDAAAQHDRLADLYLIDGSGLVHPHRIGVACHFGIVVDRPTIGVAKKLLCGHADLAGLTCDETRSIVLDGETRGVALRASTANNQVLYVSPGHRVDVPYAAQVVSRLLRGRRLPEPLYWADRLSRHAARGRSTAIAID